MAVYSRLFADYAQSSRITSVPGDLEELLWFVDLDSTASSLPQSILLTEMGPVVQYVDRFGLLSPEGKLLWSLPKDTSMYLESGDGKIFFRGANGSLYAVGSDGRMPEEEIEISSCYARCTILLLKPAANGHILLQTVNRAGEVEDDLPPEPDEFNLILQGPDGYLDKAFAHHFTGHSLPALVNAEGTRVVLLDLESKITTFDAISGETVASFETPEFGYHLASLDASDGIVIVGRSQDQVWKLVRYSQEGEQTWEYELPKGEVKVYTQPPAHDTEGNVFFLWNSKLFGLKSGVLSWEYSLPPGSIALMTVLGDGRVLVAAANQLHMVNLEGEGSVIAELDPDQYFTAPPVVDESGKLYLATNTGIACYK